MRICTTALMAGALTVIFFAQALPASAQDKARDGARERAQSGTSNLRSHRRTFTAFTVYERPIQIAAVTRRTRADTTLRKALLKERLAMREVYPGYPQPPLITFDIRVQF
jgi:hypothetical protein